MDILGSLQYWFLMIFVQFAPMDKLNANDVYKYVLVDHNKMLQITVVRKAKYQGKEYIRIKAQYTTMDRTPLKEVHFMTIHKQKKIWRVVSLLNNGREMLPDKKNSIPLKKKMPDRLLLSTDENYYLKNTSSRRSLTIIQHKHYKTMILVYTRGNEKAYIETSPELGLITARIQFSTPSMNEKIKLLAKDKEKRKVRNGR